jgi:hypothetical protein
MASCLDQFAGWRLGCLPDPATNITTEGPSHEAPFVQAKSARNRKIAYGGARGDRHGFFGDELKGTDHFSGYRTFAGFRLHNGRVFEMR